MTLPAVAWTVPVNKAQRLQIAGQQSGRRTDHRLDRRARCRPKSSRGKDQLLCSITATASERTVDCCGVMLPWQPASCTAMQSVCLHANAKAAYARGVARMAPTVGDEGLEVALAALQSDRRA